MIKVTEEYGIDFDKLNIILQERYEKREGKGKNAPLSGEFGYRDISYHASLLGVADKLVRLEMADYDGDTFEGMIEQIEELRDEIADILSENIVVKLG